MLNALWTLGEDAAIFLSQFLSTTIHGIQRHRSIQEIQVYIIITTAT